MRSAFGGNCIASSCEGAIRPPGRKWRPSSRPEVAVGPPGRKWRLSSRTEVAVGPPGRKWRLSSRPEGDQAAATGKQRLSRDTRLPGSDQQTCVSIRAVRSLPPGSPCSCKRGWQVIPSALQGSLQRNPESCFWGKRKRTLVCNREGILVPVPRSRSSRGHGDGPACQPCPGRAPTVTAPQGPGLGPASLLIVRGLFQMGNWIHVAADQRALRLGICLICLIKKHLKELSSEVP